MNILSNMQDIADLIIRPSRYLYKPVDLGPKTINSKSSAAVIHHHDYQIKNGKNQILKASLYTTQKDIKDIKKIIIYLHCNSGCRIQGLAYLNLIIDERFSYFVFDFAGSGTSEGKYISLGLNQADDIKYVIKFLRKNIKKDILIGLWGRSMGAVAALRFLMHEKNQKLIKAAIFDSPFYSLKQLFIAIGREKTNLPKLVLEMAMKYLKPIILNKAKFDVDNVHLKSLDSIKECPGIFLASKNDSLIPFAQMDTIFKQYGSTKEMFFVEESHNEPRNIKVISNAFKIMRKYFQEELGPQSYMNTVQSRILQLKESKNDSRQENERQESFYRSQIPSKEVSRKKLQLTIKSYSQKTLFGKQKEQSLHETPKKCLKEISFPRLEKRQISCLFEKQKNKIKFAKKQKNLKDSFEDYSEEAISLNSSSNFQNQHHINPHRKAQITIRKFFKEDKQKLNNYDSNTNIKSQIRQKKNEGCYDHINLIKLNSNLSKRAFPFSPKQNNQQQNITSQEENYSFKQAKQAKEQIKLTYNKNFNNIQKIGETISVSLKQQNFSSEKTFCHRKDSIIKLKEKNHGIQERKTMQHIANKKPPSIQNHRLLELRNSFQGKYKSQMLLLKK